MEIFKTAAGVPVPLSADELARSKKWLKDNTAQDEADGVTNQDLIDAAEKVGLNKYSSLPPDARTMAVKAECAAHIASSPTLEEEPTPAKRPAKPAVLVKPAVLDKKIRKRKGGKKRNTLSVDEKWCRCLYL